MRGNRVTGGKGFHTGADAWQEGVLSPRISSGTTFQTTHFHARLLFVFCMVILLLCVLIGRAFVVQVSHGSTYRVMADENRIRTTRILPERGLILDRFGEVLAGNTPAFAVGILLTRDNKERVLQSIPAIAELLQLPAEQVSQRIDEARSLGFSEALLRDGVDRDLILTVETSSIPDLFVEISPRRSYPAGEAAVHVLGYTGEVNRDELKEFPSISSGERVGKAGLERSYEHFLHGSAGKRLYETDASGRSIRQRGEKRAEKGDVVTLSLDATLQKVAHGALLEMLREKKADAGAVIVQHAQTGAVLALTSAPSYNPDVLTGSVPADVYNALAQDPRLPFFNRAISATYPPASTFKLVTATAALDEGVITPEKELLEVQTLTVNGYSFSNWTLLWGIPAHGLLDVHGALAHSSDIYFYMISGGYGDQKGLGVETIARYARLFGYGERTGIDIPGEVKGLVPSEAYKQETFGEAWYLGDNYITGIGQGYMLATPLQVSQMTTAVANGGKLLRPYLVETIATPEDVIRERYGPTLIREVGSPEALAHVRLGMREAVEYGTAVELKDHPLRIAAKTGTAETGNDDRIHAWFTAFAPYENPTISITVLVEEGGQGSQVALPIAKKVLDAYAEQLKNNSPQ